MPRGMRTALLTAKEMKRHCQSPSAWGRNEKGSLMPSVSPDLRFSLMRVKWRVIGLFAIDALLRANGELIKMIESRNALLSGARNGPSLEAIYSKSEIAYSNYMAEANWLREEIESAP